MCMLTFPNWVLLSSLLGFPILPHWDTNQAQLSEINSNPTSYNSKISQSSDPSLWTMDEPINQYYFYVSRLNLNSKHPLHVYHITSSSTNIALSNPIQRIKMQPTYQEALKDLTLKTNWARTLKPFYPTNFYHQAQLSETNSIKFALAINDQSTKLESW